MKTGNWSDAEIDASVRTYMEMLSKEKSSLPYKKADFRNQLLAGDLKGRTAGSFEYRMQNISHVLNTLSLQYIVGYKPAKNVGTNTFNSITRSLERNCFIDLHDFEPTADSNKLDQRTKRIRKGIDVKSKPVGHQKPQKTEATTTTYYRDPAVKAWVLENANGKCEACESQAPFLLSDGEAFLEVHHMIPLAEDGPDIVENAVALCPNCHRRCHLSRDRSMYNSEIYRKVARLVKN